jgi:type VI secretion system secreted protein Hcp
MAMQAYFKVIGIGTNNSPATIELLSFQWGVGRGIATGSGGGAGKVDIKEITITKQTDAASPHLLAACVNGEHLSSAEIGILLPAVQSSTGPEFLKYEFTNIILSEFEAGGNFGGAALPVETLKFEFGQVAILLPAVQ